MSTTFKTLLVIDTIDEYRKVHRCAADTPELQRECQGFAWGKTVWCKHNRDADMCDNHALRVKEES